jgi:hypothetical protein
MKSSNMIDRFSRTALTQGAMMLTTMLLACGSESSDNQSTSTVSGQITSGGCGMLGAGYSVRAVIGGSVVNAPLDGNGNFSLPLPGGSAAMSAATVPFLANYTTPGCSGTLQATPPQPMVAAAQFDLRDAAGAFYAPLVLADRAPSGLNNGTFLVYYLYAPQDTSITGQQTCTSASSVRTSIYNLQMKSGWNIWLDDSATTQTMGQPAMEQNKYYISTSTGNLHWYCTK